MYKGLFNQLTADRSVIVEDIDELGELSDRAYASYVTHNEALGVVINSIDESYGYDSGCDKVYHLFGIC